MASNRSFCANYFFWALLFIGNFAGLLSPTNSLGQTFTVDNDTLHIFCPPDTAILSGTITGTTSTASYTSGQIPFSPEPVGGTGSTGADDQVVGPFNIGFSFSYFNNTYTQFYIGTNGWVGFTGGQTGTWVVTTIPNTGFGTPKNCIMSVWRDWYPTGGTYIYYQTIGTAPCRKLVVTFSAIPMFSCTSTYGTFQIVLHESTNIIDNHLTAVPNCMTWGGGDGTHGVHNLAGTIGTVVAGRNESPFTAFNESWRWSPSSTLTWTDQTGQVAGTGNCLPVSPTTSGWYYGSIVDVNGNIITDSTYIVVSCAYLEMDSIDVECTGTTTGYAIATDTIGSYTPPFKWYWKDQNNDTVAVHTSNNISDTLMNIGAGTYTCILIDHFGNAAIGTTTINEPDTLPAYIATMDALCYQESNGTAIVVDTHTYSGLNWDGYYNYLWANASGTIIGSKSASSDNSDTINLSAGNYSVTVDGCFVQTGTFTIDEPPILLGSVINDTETSCPGGLTCDASAEANGVGGTPPYSYLWSTGETTKIANNLCFGINTVTITDANGCDTNTSVNITAPDPIVTSGFGDTLICISNVTNLIAATTGGTPPYSFEWTKGSLGGPFVGDNGIQPVEPHITTTYFVTSTDVNGCIGDTADVVISVRPPLGNSITSTDTICPYDTIPITSTGTGGDSIYTYAWSTGTIAPTTYASPDLPGYVYVTVSDACGSPSYKDSVWVQVGGYPRITSSIKLNEDSLCVGEGTYMTVRGVGGFRGPKEYRYSWSTGTTGDFLNVVPNTTTTYFVTINDLCISEPGIDSVTVFVGPYVEPVVEASPQLICAPGITEFTMENFNTDYTYNWGFGDGSKKLNQQEASLAHTYAEKGCYDIDIQTITDFGCETNVTLPCMVQVFPTPVADFSSSPENPTSEHPIVELRDQSSEADRIEWHINGQYISDLRTTTYLFSDTGEHELQLIAINEDGCMDTIQKTMVNSLVKTIYIPTGFSPNNDGKNDVFGIVGEGIQEEGFKLEVFDRWGGTIFSSNDPQIMWNGRDKKGELLPIGIYAYKVQYIDNDQKSKSISGTITLTRSKE